MTTCSRQGTTRRIGAVGLIFAVVAVAVVTVAAGAASSAAPVPQRVDLRVLVLDDESAWLNALESQLVAEGVPYTAIPLSSPTRSRITPEFLAAGNRAFYQAVISPDYLGGNLTGEELSALREYEARFGIREVDAFNWAHPGIGLNYASPDYGGYAGDLAGVSASVTAAGTAGGFGYLDGPVPFSTGSYSFLGQPLTTTSSPPITPGGNFTTLVSAPIPGSSATGSVIGVYANAGVEQMIITAAFNFHLPQFKLVAHGIVSWATRGVHFGYNRNYMTFHVDDGFASVAVWDPERKCTPGEDCPPDGDDPPPVRMTAEDVEYAVAWQQQHDYDLTIAFNGAYALAGDPLTAAFQLRANSFKWLNHGSEHIYQGCIQDFSVIPWRCATDPTTGEVLYLPQEAIYREIQNNIDQGIALGLPFDVTEYLSGEHSGFAQLPQMPQDNPHFAPALTQAGILAVATDASREPAQRQIGSALTIPRHPTAIFYNTATVEQAVSEYNWFYTSRANGGSGYCEDNPQTATCIAPLDSATGFRSYIVPSDAAYNLGFILSNDPRPFYAHTSNLTADRILYPLLETILSTYNAGFQASAPLVNLTQTQAVQVLGRQTGWAANGMVGSAVSGYIENGQVTIINNSGSAAPLTVPNGSSVGGVTLEPYGGELSAWLPPTAVTIGTLPAPSLTVESKVFVVGQFDTLTISAAGSPAPTISLIGSLPTGVAFMPGTGTATISGTPAPGTAGSYPVTVTATSGSARMQEQLTLTVQQRPAFTSASSATATPGSPFTFAVTTSGSPTPTVSRTGTLPAGVTFTANADGSATLAGTPTGSGGTYPLTLTATNASGSTTQAFTLTVTATQAPRFTSAASTTAVVGSPFSFQIATTGIPTATITRAGGDALPAGITFTANTDGTATLAGTPGPGTAGNFTYSFNFRAQNSAGTVTQTFALRVNEAPAFTSAASTNATSGTAFSFVVRAGGFPRAALSVTGTLPAGISFSPNTNGTATLAGTPTVTGTYPLTFTAVNVVATVTQAFTLTVRRVPSITSAPSATAVAGTPFNFTMTTTGSPTPTVSRTGGLPAGITFTANANGTGTLAGTAAAGTGNTYPLTLRAQNSAGSVTQNFTLVVNEKPAITSAVSRVADIGTAFTFVVRTSGFPRAAVTMSGTLPAGLTFTSNTDGTATLAGTATGPAAIHPLTFTATNALGTATQAFSLRVR